MSFPHRPLLLSGLIARLAAHLAESGDRAVILDAPDRERVVREHDVEIEDEGPDARLRSGDQVWRITVLPT